MSGKMGGSVLCVKAVGSKVVSEVRLIQSGCFGFLFPDYYLREVHKAQYLAVFSQSCEACISYASNGIQ